MLITTSFTPNTVRKAVGRILIGHHILTYWQMAFELQLSRIVCTGSSLAIKESLLNNLILVRHSKILVGCIGSCDNNFPATGVASHLSHWLSTSLAAHTDGLLATGTVLLALESGLLTYMGLVGNRVSN